MADRRSEPVTMGDALKRYLNRLDKKGKLEEASIIGHWNEAVGANIGQHTVVRGLRNGELLIAVDSPVWAAELSAMSDELRERLREKTGKDSVRAIRFTVSRAVEAGREQDRSRTETERRYGGEKVSPVPLSDQEREAVERSVAGIEDAELRAAALRATVRDLEWKKGIESSKRR